MTRNSREEKCPAPGAHAALVTVASFIEERQNYASQTVAPYDTPPLHKNIAAFPAEIILSQQVQLDELRNQVAELRAIIQSLVDGSLTALSIQNSKDIHSTLTNPTSSSSSYSSFVASASSSTYSSRENTVQVEEVKQMPFLVPTFSTTGETVGVTESEIDEEGDNATYPPLIVPARDQNFEIAAEIVRKHPGTRHNPLASRNPAFPVLRPRGEEEALLMEPAEGTVRYGENPFPAPRADPDGIDVDSDYEGGDEDNQLDIRQYLQGNQYRTSSENLDDSISMCDESASILEIQARYI